MVSAGPDQVVWGVQELALSPLIGFWFGFVLHQSSVRPRTEYPPDHRLRGRRVSHHPRFRRVSG
ncbi:hypothetical protein SAMN02745729_12713 [Marinobacterium iners DSM 11526]|uniref:Uncharacterized protein n=1 Tax=Marinobacterium iners DSM 11526 TaxID=1122198 RepID=A0A1H4H3Y8_9GAMM|nr:hypothetical protein SAMN02745729_12713 [Marinobacterium iners DSM 11526]